MLWSTLHNLSIFLADTRFDMTVTMGNVLTILAFAVAALAFGFRLEARTKENEAANKRHGEWIAAHAECNKKQIEILGKLEAAIAYFRGRAGFPEIGGIGK